MCFPCYCFRFEDENKWICIKDCCHIVDDLISRQFTQLNTRLPKRRKSSTLTTNLLLLPSLCRHGSKHRIHECLITCSWINPHKSVCEAARSARSVGSVQVFPSPRTRRRGGNDTSSVDKLAAPYFGPQKSRQAALSPQYCETRCCCVVFISVRVELCIKQ